MPVKAIPSQYQLFTAEERFRLILVASGRDDSAERDKLVSSTKTKPLSFSEHWPYAQAFCEISTFVFLELVEESTQYQHCLVFHPSKSKSDSVHESESASKEWLKEVDLVLAMGCLLNLKLKGWDLFCQKLCVPDRLLWMEYPGYDRLMKTLEISKNWAFKPKGLLRWMNRRRPKGSPKLKRLPVSSKKMALSHEELYRQRAHWWGAKP